MIIYQTFYRRFVLRKTAQLNGTFPYKSDMVELPKASVIHLVDDNFSFNKPITFMPSLTGWSMNLKPKYKFIHHVKEPPQPVAYQYPEYFRLPATGLNAAINNLRKSTMRFMKPIKDLMDMPTRIGVVNLINYNPLFRARIFGIRRSVRRFNYIWGSIINMLAKLPTSHAQYIPIPIGNTKYERSDFLMSFKAYTRATIKYPEDPWYLFMMNLIGFLHSKPTESIFEKIPKHLWKNIHFMLYGKTKVFIFTLNEIKLMNKENDVILNRFIKHLNVLVEDSTETVTTVPDDRIDQTQFKGGRDDVEETSEDDKKDFEDVNKDPDTMPPPERVKEATPIYKRLHEPTPEPVIDDDNGRYSEDDVQVSVPDLIVPVYITNDPQAMEQPKSKVFIQEDTPEETPNTDLTVDTTKGLAKKPYRQPIKPQVVQKKQEVKKQEPQVKKPDIPKVEEIKEPEPILLPELLDIEEIDMSLLTVDRSKGLNKHNTVKEVTKEQVAKFNDRFVKDLDARAEKAIEANKTRLTPAQLTRAKKMSEQYKKITFNGKPLVDIILDVPEDTVSTNKLDFLANEIPDDSMLKSSVKSFDDDYINKYMEKDLVTNLVSFNTQGMFLKEIETNDISDDLDKMVTYKAKYEDVHHKEHTIKFTLPKVDQNGYCQINGTMKVFKKQRVVVPICKISNIRVTLNSDYNKFLVERNTAVAHSLLSYVDRILKGSEPKSHIAIINGMSFPKEILPYDYTAVAAKYIKLIITKDTITTLYFNYPERFNWLQKEMSIPNVAIDTIKSIEEETGGVFFGVTKLHTALFMMMTGEVKIFNYNDETLVQKDICLTDLLCSLLDVSISRLSEWVDFKLLNKSVPLAFALCYRYGLNYMLNYTKTRYTVVKKGSRVTGRNSDIVIQFADAKLVIPRSPLVNSLIFAGLNNFNLSKVEIEAMNSKDVYYELLQSKGISVHNLKGIDDYFELFIDPITRDVLFRMGEPTDPKDLLIRAAQLLSTEDHAPPSSEANYRYRSYERFNTAVYKSIARAHATYKNKAIGASNKMSISEYEVKQLIIQDQLMENAGIINPINDIKYKAAYSHSGYGGRESVDTFVLNDRQYPDDGVGTISEATVDNMKTGYVASLSVDPVLTNMRGMPKPVTTKELEPAQMLSVTSMLVPCVTNDDGKRANFVNIHLSQYMPTLKSEPSRIRTGYEEVIAHRTVPPFAYAAEADGVVEKVDDNTSIATVFYPKLNKRVALKFGEEYTNNGGGGFYCTQNVTLNNYTTGDKFKKGDVLIYNNRFFTPNAYTKQVAWNIGVLTNTILIDANATLDDSSIISTRLAKDLEINPVFVKDIVLKKNTTIHKFADVGTKVTNVDSLMIFDQSEMSDDMFGKLDDEAIALLAKLNKKSARSGHNGVIVKLDMFYKSTIKDVSNSIQALMNLVNKRKMAVRKAASGAINESDYPGATNIKNSDRIGGIDLDDETVIVRFYIQDSTVMGGGDKIEFDSSLKSVCTAIAEPWEVEDGSVTCDAWFSAIGINNRIILSPIITGIGNRCMEKLEKDIVDMYFKK